MLDCTRLCSPVPLPPAQRLFLDPFPLGNFYMKISDLLLYGPDVWLLPETLLSLFICPYLPWYYHCFSFIGKLWSP